MDEFIRLDTGDTRAQFAAQLIERLRTKLLNLTARNPLLNYRHSDKARAQIRVIDEAPDDIYFRLVDGKELSFRALEEPPDVPEDEKSDDFQMAVEAARLEDEEYLSESQKLEGDDPNNPTFIRLERDLKDRVRLKLGLPPRPTRATMTPAECARLHGIEPSYDLPRLDAPTEDQRNHNEIQTLLFPDRMEAKLSALRDAARRTMEEQGINTLFAAYAFLEWYEAPQSNKPYYAPLLLQQLEIERVPYRGRWRYFVRATGDDITHNITLAERLKQDFSLELPEFAEDDSPESYCTMLEGLISKQKNWRVRRFLTFGLFSFGRLVMWHDLDIARWPDQCDPSTNPLVATLLAGGSGGESIHADDYPVDNPEWANKLPTLILDADSSQISSILDAMDGKNLAIKGPPGTGKSQTITNLIAAALSAGKRVLFLAEKMAALQVVKSRLDDAGLGYFVLELHSTKAKKKELLNNLAQRLEQQNKIRPPEKISEERSEQDKLKRQLTNYVNLLNAPFGKTGKTLHDIIWAIQRDRNIEFPEAIDQMSLEHATDLTQEGFERCELVMKSFETVWTDISKRWTSPNEHPWSWVETILSPFDYEELLSATRNWKNHLNDLISLSNEPRIQSLGLIPISPNWTEFNAFCETLDRLPGKTPGHISSKLLTLLQDSKFRNTISTLQDLWNRRDALEKKCSPLISVTIGLGEHQDLAELAKFLSILNVDDQLVGEIEEIIKRTEHLHTEWQVVQRTCTEITSLLGIPPCETFEDLKLFVDAIDLVTITPKSVMFLRDPKLADAEAREIIERAKGHSQTLSQTHRGLEQRFDLQRAGKPTELRRNAFVLRNTNFLGRLRSRYRQAKTCWRDLTLQPRNTTRHEKAGELERLAIHLEELNAFASAPRLCELLGSAFNGLKTNFDSFLRTADFLIAGRRLTSGTGKLRTALRNIFLTGPHEKLYQLTEFASGEAISVMRKGLGILSGVKADSFDDITHTLAYKSETASRLLNGARHFQLNSSIRLGTLNQLVEDLADLKQIDGQISSLSQVHQLIQATRIDPSVDKEVINATVCFANELTSVLSGDQKTLIQYVFSEAVEENLGFLINFKVNISSKRNAEAAARQEVLRKAGTNENSFTDFISRAPLTHLLSHLETALAEEEALNAWNSYLKVKQEVTNELLWPIVEGYGERKITNLSAAFRRVIWRSIARKAFKQHPELKTFSGLNQEIARSRFRAIDERLLDLSKQELAAELSNMHAPVGNARGPKSEWSELSLVRQPSQLQRTRINVRGLMRRAGNAVQALKPCWMMSPTSVAQYPHPGARETDLVIIDEASQVRPEEAIGAIARGRQVVVVGDPMQLPPTAFFERVDAFDDEQLQDLEEESILDMALATFYPYRNLNWHYRSKHESLIAFSNKQFYDNRLTVFPAASNDGRLGVNYHYVNGVYQGRGGNPQEVKVVAEAAIEFMKFNPEWSLGLVTVNLEQAELLRLEIDRLVLRQQQAQEYIQRWEGTLESFFVKNLENVQGDERDCIMISTVYGRNQAGQVMQRFGPINQKTGHRRLNVLFTRAKCRIDIYSSLTSADVHEDERVSEGVKALKSYLEYAATGRLEVGTVTNKDPDSDFEIFVAEALTSRGYQAVPQVGVAGFFIDIGVKHPRYPHGFLAGIECDGATYHSAKSARDRDALRQEILEGLGWDLYRVWSVDWFSNPKVELEKLLRFLDRLLDGRQPRSHNDPRGSSSPPPGSHAPAPEAPTEDPDQRRDKADPFHETGDRTPNSTPSSEDLEWAKNTGKSTLRRLYQWAKTKDEFPQLEVMSTYWLAVAIANKKNISQLDARRAKRLYEKAVNRGFSP